MEENITQDLTLDSLEESSFTDEKISELKALGFKKPAKVSWGRWIGPKEHNHVHNLIVQLAAVGTSNNNIAEAVGLTPSRISIILSQPEMKSKIAKVQEQYWGSNADKRFKHLLPKAIDVAERVLNESSDDKLQVDVAFRLMDRALGKPKQEVAVTGNLLSELMSRLDNQEQMREVIELNKLAKPKDNLDNFVDVFVPTELTVGKRE